jgi:hypothetical protein
MRCTSASLRAFSACCSDVLQDRRQHRGCKQQSMWDKNLAPGNLDHNVAEDNMCIDLACGMWTCQ